MTLKKGEVEAAGSENEKEQKGSDVSQKSPGQENQDYAALNAKFETLTKQLAEIQAQKSTNDVAAIAAAVAAAMKSVQNKEINYEEGIDEVQIPLDDYTETGTVFYCPLVGYVLSDDRRKGMIVKLPHGKKMCFFEHYATRRQGTGKYETTAPISKYTSHSKLEIQWIRDHNLYGTMFFEADANTITHDDSRFAARAAQIAQVLKTQELSELMTRCREYNVSPDPDINVMRRVIAKAMVKREIDEEALRTQRIVDETFKSGKLLGRV